MAQEAAPAHTIAWTAGGCEIVLVPAATRGAEAPRLRLTASGSLPEARIEIGLILPPGAANPEFVAEAARSPFVPAGPGGMAQVMTSRFWVDVLRLDQQGRPFWITARTAAGGWISSRYDGLSPRMLIQLVERSCGLELRGGSPLDALALWPLPGASEAAAQAAEAALRLRPDQRLHIRWVLHSLYADPAAEPGDSPELTEQDRGFVARFRVQNGLAESRWLDEDTALRLLRSPFQPRDPPLGAIGTVVTTSRDWITLISRDGEFCHAVSLAVAQTGFNLYRKPRIQFGARRGRSDANLQIDLLLPNLLDPARPVSALVDGRRIELAIRDDALRPVMLSDGADTAVMRAIRLGREIVIQGTARDTGRPASATFSAAGFSAAFDTMAQICGRSGLGVWFQ